MVRICVNLLNRFFPPNPPEIYCIVTSPEKREKWYTSFLHLPTNSVLLYLLMTNSILRAHLNKLKTKNQKTIFSAATGLLARTSVKEDAVVASGDELRCYWWWIFFGFLLEICWISSWKSWDVVASGDGLLLVVPISRNGSRLTLQPTRGHQPLLGAAPKDVTPWKRYLFDDLTMVWPKLKDAQIKICCWGHEAMKVIKLIKITKANWPKNGQGFEIWSYFSFVDLLQPVKDG